MRGDIPEAALRLSCCSSSVVTHERRIHIHPQGGSNNATTITIDGVVYESILATKKALHVSGDTVRKWIDQGRARRG